MKVIKKINNNFAVCIDNNNRELIAYGSGIGFPSIPYELSDLSKIDRTYYGIESSYLKLIDEIPDKIFEISTRIVDMARSYTNSEYNNNVVFTLADHIHFAIERTKRNIYFNTPLSYDIKYFYENEMEIGRLALKIIHNEMNEKLHEDEAVNIAMHFVNAAMMNHSSSYSENDLIINELTEIIEIQMKFKIKKDEFNYSRFVSHLQYLLKRKNVENEISSENLKIFNSMKEQFPNAYESALLISTYIVDKLKWTLNQEELMYLMLHINRLYVREDCNR